MSRQQWGHGYWNGVADGVKARFDFKEYCLMYPRIGNKDSAILCFANDVQCDNGFPVRHIEEPIHKYKRRIWNHMHGVVNGRISRPCREAEMAFVRLWSEWRKL